MVHGLHLASILLLASASNADNLGVGIAYGVKGTSIPLASNLLIAAITGTGTLLSMLAGTTIATLIQPELAALMGGLVIIGAGVWVLIEEARRRPVGRPPRGQTNVKGNAISEATALRKLFILLDNPCAADRDLSGHVDLKESFLLGSALTLNNLVNGLAAGLLGLSPVITTCFVVILSVLALWVGISAGCSVGYRWLGRLAGPVSGFILIFVGICSLFL